MVVNNLGRTRKNTLVERFLHTSVIYFVCTAVGKWWWCCLDSFATPWTVARQAPLSRGLPRQEYWSGLPFPSPGDLTSSEIKPRLPLWRWILYCWVTREAPWLEYQMTNRVPRSGTLNFPLLTWLPGKSFILEVSVGARYLCSSSRRKKNIA